MSYTLNYTAEQIDHKLNLINENKNLLVYPYSADFPVGLEDIGDGSILTTANAYTSQEILLTTCTLPAGDYVASLNITDLAEKPVDTTNFALVIKRNSAVIAATKSYSPPTIGAFKLDIEAVVEVYLSVPAGFNTNLLIKPQIEAGTEKTTWVPYMDKIGSYVDERFNSVNAKLRNVFTLMNLIEIIEE